MKTTIWIAESSLPALAVVGLNGLSKEQKAMEAKDMSRAKLPEYSPLESKETWQEWRARNLAEWDAMPKEEQNHIVDIVEQILAELIHEAKLIESDPHFQ